MLELDHVVYFSKQSPEAHVQNHPGTTIGGRHKNWGTVNALTYSKNSYIEYLSVEHPEVAKSANHPLTNLLLNDLESGEGWGTICFRTSDIQALNERLVNEGWKTSGVLDAERETSSGFVRKWKMLFIKQEVTDRLPYPFFIEWEEPFNVRMQRLRADGTLKPYNESLQITKCEFAVQDPDHDVKEWGKLLNTAISGHTIGLVNTELVFTRAIHGKERLVHVQITK
jgi:hypothetical protein